MKRQARPFEELERAATALIERLAPLAIVLRERVEWPLCRRTGN